MELVTAAEMRELDRAAIETRNIPSLRLMENAGKAVVQEMERFFGPLRGRAITVVAGKGQNGGGGFVSAGRPCKGGGRAGGGLLASPAALEGAGAPNIRRVYRGGGRRPRGRDPAPL